MRTHLLLAAVVLAASSAHAQGSRPPERDVTLTLPRLLPEDAPGQHQLLELIVRSRELPGGPVDVTTEGSTVRLRGPAAAVDPLGRLLSALDAQELAKPLTIPLWDGWTAVVLARKDVQAWREQLEAAAKAWPRWEREGLVVHDYAGADLDRGFAVAAPETLARAGLTVDPAVVPPRAKVTEDGAERRAVTFTPRRLRGDERLAALQAVLADALAGEPVEVTVEGAGLTIAGPPPRVDGVVRLAEALDDPVAGIHARTIPLWDGRSAVAVPAADAADGRARFEELVKALGLAKGPGPRKRGQPAVAWSPALLQVVAAGAPRDLEKLVLPD